MRRLLGVPMREIIMSPHATIIDAAAVFLNVVAAEFKSPLKVTNSSVDDLATVQLLLFII